MEAWKKFAQTRYGHFAKFYIKLYDEIAGINNDFNESAVLILNTKKGDWLYKIFEWEERRSADKIEVYSD